MEDTFFWWDPWTPFGPLIHYFGSSGPYLLGILLVSTVSDLITPTGWNLSPSRSEKQTLLYAFITTIPLSSGSDYATWMIDDVAQDEFVTKTVWNSIRPIRPLATWSSLIWFRARVPKHAFTTWLFVLNRNPTLDRITRWGCDVEQTCLLCGIQPESRDHLFFECIYSLQIWLRICSKLGIVNPPTMWDQIISWLPKATTNKTIAIALLQAWQGCIYEIWRERNSRYHSGITLTPDSVFKFALSIVRNRAQSLVNQNQKWTLLLLCWANN